MNTFGVEFEFGEQINTAEIDFTKVDVGLFATHTRVNIHENLLVYFEVVAFAFEPVEEYSIEVNEILVEHFLVTNALQDCWRCWWCTFAIYKCLL